MGRPVKADLGKDSLRPGLKDEKELAAQRPKEGDSGRGSSNRKTPAARTGFAAAVQLEREPREARRAGAGHPGPREARRAGAGHPGPGAEPAFQDQV